MDIPSEAEMADRLAKLKGTTPGSTKMTGVAINAVTKSRVTPMVHKKRHYIFSGTVWPLSNGSIHVVANVPSFKNYQTEASDWFLKKFNHLLCRRWFLELLEQNCPHHIKGLENLV